MTNNPNPSHLHLLNDLFQEIYFLNERINSGDYAKAELAMPKAEKLVKACSNDLKEQAATGVWLQAYVATGGMLGVQYVFKSGDIEIKGSVIPRRR